MDSLSRSVFSHLNYGLLYSVAKPCGWEFFFLLCFSFPLAHSSTLSLSLLSLTLTLTLAHSYTHLRRHLFPESVTTKTRNCRQTRERWTMIHHWIRQTLNKKYMYVFHYGVCFSPSSKERGRGETCKGEGGEGSSQLWSLLTFGRWISF